MASGLASVAVAMGLAPADAPVIGAAGTETGTEAGMALATADAPTGLATEAGVATAAGRAAGTASAFAIAGSARVAVSGLTSASRAVVLTF